MKKFRCTVCGYVYEGDAAPEKCPLCKAPASKFVEVEEATADGPLVFADEHVIGVAKGCDDEMRQTVKAILKLQKLSSVTLGKKQNTLLNSLNCWVTAYGTPRQTSKRE